MFTITDLLKRNKKAIKESSMKDFLIAINEKTTGYKTPFINEQSLKNFEERTLHSSEFYILEATYEHDLDIEYIYQKYAKPFIIDLLSNSEKYLKQYKKDKKIIPYIFASSELPSDLAKQAVIKNPITITVGIYGDNSYYEDFKNHIHINIIAGSDLQYIINSNYKSFEEDKGIKKQITDLINLSIKPSISHELTHWLDDSLKNSAIKKYIGSLNKKFKDDEKEKAIRNYLRSYIEVQASVHDVKQYKKDIGDDKWNKITLKQMFDDSGLTAVANEIRNDKKAFLKWKKQIVKRLAREDLIGNNMKSEDLSKI